MNVNMIIWMLIKILNIFREEKCNWESPTGERCFVAHQEFTDKSRCVEGASVAWATFGSGNCTIQITSGVVERNGDWKVWLKFETIKKKKKIVFWLLYQKFINSKFFQMNIKCVLNTALDDSGESSEGVVNLKIAKPARVSVEPYGTLHSTQGKQKLIFISLIFIKIIQT